MKQKHTLTMSDGRYYLVLRLILFFLLATFTISVPAAPAAAAEPFTAATIGDFGHVTVMEVSGNYDQMTPEGLVNAVPRELIAQEFYRTHKDEYDFLTIFSTFDFKLKAEAVAFYLGVKNDTLGIGSEVFDNGHLYGSGGKLQGTVDMGNITKLASSPLDPRFEFSLDILAHEMLHRWSAFVKFRDASGNLSAALLGKDGSHWSYLLDSKGSLEYGNSWRDNGDGTFTSVAARKYYSPLDLYLMGMIDSSKVPPVLLIDNPSIDPKKVSGAGDTISGTPRYISIEDIVSAEGERVPKAEVAQKQFKMAFILITPGTLTRDDLNGVENIRKGFLTRFSILTDGQGLVQIAPTKKEELATNPDVLPPDATPRTVTPSIDEGVSWLLAAQQEEGYWGGLQTAPRDTAKAITVLGNFPLTGTAQPRALQWLAASGAKNTDYLSAKIAALAHAGEDFSLFIDALLSMQNPDGGWGSNRNYQSDPIDTCSAMQALLAANSTAAAGGKGANYLLARQNADGGWGFQTEASSNVLITAEVAAILQRLPPANALAMAVNTATAFLLNRQNLDGGFGSSPSTVYETALAYRALSGVISDATVLKGAINYLYAAQGSDGSWQQEPYSTALAIEALHLSGMSPPVIPTSGTVTGTVVDRATAQPLDGATVTFAGDSAITAVTAAGGVFSLADVPAGAQSIAVSLNGYAPATQSVSITAGSILNLGSIKLGPNPTMGMIKGVITAAASGEPLADVSVTITGAFAGTVLTKGDGSFAFVNVTPGAMTITASKTGYRSAAGTGTIIAGSVLSFHPQLTIQSPLPPPPSSTPGTLMGRIVDGATNEPLSGVAGFLKSNPTIASVSDAAGGFTLEDVPPGTQAFEFSLPGYATSTATVEISAGAIVNFGTFALSSYPTTGSIKGLISAAVDGRPLSGATITVTGSFSGSTVTGADGTFILEGTPGSVTITVSKAGYAPLTGTGTVSVGGVLVVNLQMTELIPVPTTSVLAGTVHDGVTLAPVPGAVISPLGENPVATDAQGVFTISNLAPGTCEVTVSASGYASQHYQIMTVAGVNADMEILLMPLAPTTTATGHIIASPTGLPIAGAAVEVVGTSLTTTTTADGSYTIAAINLLDFSIRAAATGYDSGIVHLTTTGFGLYQADLQLVPSHRDGIAITALAPDIPAYRAYDPVTIAAEIANDGTVTIEGLVNLTIVNPQGEVVNVQEATWTDEEGVAHNRFSFVPGVSTPVAFHWNSGFSSPGDYKMIVIVVEGVPGISAATVADQAGSFVIEPTQAVSVLTVTPTPLFTNLGATEHMELAATVVNTSNVPTSLDLGYVLRSPTGSLIHSGAYQIVLAPEEYQKNIALAPFAYTFTASGNHPLVVTIDSGPVPATMSGKAVSVAPGTRIDPTVTLSPGSVIPDGDKRIRINFQLKGVELQ
ncbi:MAG: hypothetical protein A2091_10110 [Desulfuromonadales bacterium GWD2_61_12]|nr:MAG: hypothetical protein A2091_10110 [Desulfuromonadales bacterium GWD2_61_12]